MHVVISGTDPGSIGDLKVKSFPFIEDARDHATKECRQHVIDNKLDNLAEVKECDHGCRVLIEYRRVFTAKVIEID